MNRNHFFLLGVIILYLGLQCRFVESFVLNEKASRYLSNASDAAAAPADRARCRDCKSCRPRPCGLRLFRRRQLVAGCLCDRGWHRRSAGPPHRVATTRVAHRRTSRLARATFPVARRRLRPCVERSIWKTAIRTAWAASSSPLDRSWSTSRPAIRAASPPAFVAAARGPTFDPTATGRCDNRGNDNTNGPNGPVRTGSRTSCSASRRSGPTGRKRKHSYYRGIPFFRRSLAAVSISLAPKR